MYISESQLWSDMMRSVLFMFLLSLTEARSRGPRHSHEARVKLWHVARAADTCGQFSELLDARVTKPSSLCDTYEVRAVSNLGMEI